MANSSVRVPPDSTGKTIATRAVTRPGDPSPVERQQVELGTTNPRTSSATPGSVAVGGTATLRSAAATLNKIAKLHLVVVSAAVAYKVELATVANDVVTPKLTVHEPMNRWEFAPPSPEFIQVVNLGGAGFTGFQVTITDQREGTGSAADVFTTFFYDEEDA